MEIVGVLHKLARSPACGSEKDADAKEAAGKYDHFPFKQRLTNARVLRCRVVPSPGHPSKRLVDTAAYLGPQQRSAKRRLIFKPRGDELRCREIHHQEHQQSEAGSAPVVAAKIAGFFWRS